MPLYGYIMVGLLVVSTLTTIAMVDKPREATSGPVAAVITVINLAFAWGIFELARAC